jgi:type II secretory ATPase GspE/PulE/Tfp pilus assembly ATPase PilB-like protein
MPALDGTVFYRKKGCPRCNHTGYRGRIGVFQFLRMSEEIAALAVQHASRDEIARVAAENGMRSMWDDGVEKVASGLTSIEELARILS